MQRLLCSIFLLLVASHSFANGDVAQLHLMLSSAKSLKAEFSQTVYDSDGAVLQESHGDVALQRPNKVRWHSKQPFQYLLVSNGETLWRYDADLEQLNVEPFDPDLAQAPTMILGASIEQLQKNFVVELKKQGAEHRFVLTPKNDAGNFSELVLHFNQGKLTAMALIDALEQRTEITFINANYNPEFSADEFVFKEGATSRF